jgi:DNA polymerase
MTDERTPGATFALDRIGWIDFETKSETDIKQAGAVRYATEADAVMMAWAIGDMTPQLASVGDFPATLRWEIMPQAVREHHARVMRGEAVWAAFNAGFDKAVWNYATDFPKLEAEHIIDVMAQATAAGLPPDLFSASVACGGALKAKADGTKLLRLFCMPGAEATPRSHPEEWARLCDYARDDIEAMRSVFKRTRQLPMAEWCEYWAMEKVNERGICCDLKMAVTGDYLADEDKLRARHELNQLTLGSVRGVGEVGKIVNWMLPQLPSKAIGIITKREEEIDENGELIKPARLQLTRQRIVRLLADLKERLENPKLTKKDRVILERIHRVLEIRRYGGSTTPKKFAKMLSQSVGGVLYGQYVFNGAGQTGRASSRGVQIHNLTREFLPYEYEACTALIDGTDYDTFAALGDNSPVSRKLSLLLRPALLPETEDRVFVWSDWAQIEARVLPWLAGDASPGALERVRAFAEVDANPKLPDLYTRSAAAMMRVQPEDVTKAMRQRGKVAELALGYMGGVGALQSMAANYGMALSDDDAKAIVAQWREANTWAAAFGRELWEACLEAYGVPGHYVPAGRVGFIFLHNYLGGSLLMRLPSGRFLTYRQMRWADIEIVDDDDKPTGEFKREMVCNRGYGRIKLWPGLLVENATQATAADFLRGTLRRLIDEEFDVRLHTHDEILCEVPERDAEATRKRLREVMQRGFDWSEGLPINSDETVNPYYSKWESE